MEAMNLSLIMLIIKIESETGVIGKCVEVMIYRIRVGIVGRTKSHIWADAASHTIAQRGRTM